MTFIMDFIRGIFVGVANVIPGVSGGTMAVSLGIYDKMISALTGLLKNWKKSLTVLLPILLGAVVGILGFAVLIERLMEHFPLPTCLAFIGLIIGGIPILAGALKLALSKERKRLNAGHAAAFILLFAFAIVMSLLKGEGVGANLQNPGIGTVILLFFTGAIASATMVVPGVSGSMVLMILGYYNGIIGAINDFLSALKVFDLSAMLGQCMILVPFGLGVVIGIFAIAKLIEFLFARYSIFTYCAILGLIFASPFAILIHMGMVEIKLLQLAAGVILLAAGAFVTYQLGVKKDA